MAVDIFRDATRKVPESDNMIVRVSMRQLEIAGRTMFSFGMDRHGAALRQHVVRCRRVADSGFHYALTTCSLRAASM
jgi:hypothetical protein